MFSAWKDIAVFLDQTPDGQTLGRQAAGLAQRHGAHLVGIYGARHDPVHASARHARGEKAISQVLTQSRQADEAKIIAAGRVFGALAKAHQISSEFRLVWRDGDDSAVPKGLHCDLIVAGHPKPSELPEGWTGERLLLATGTPVLLVPTAWGEKPIGQTVTIAWNGSREVRRAVNDAMPILTTASRIVVLVVQGQHLEAGAADHFGEEVIQHLARHGLEAELKSVVSDGSQVQDVIRRQATALGADLLVLGAYSRPRSAEILFGGVTRSLLANPDQPLLFSR